MVAYHTPKVYRSPLGCCICRAKYISSRFTDSSRYEGDFGPCFLLDEPRFGEICNACVLLIKRFKKLPVGKKKHWHHIVDARARPRGRGSIKPYRDPISNSDHPSATSSPSSSSVNSLSLANINEHKNVRRRPRARSPAESEDQYTDDILSETSATSVPSSRAPSPFPSASPFLSEDEVASVRTGSSKRKQEMPLRSKFKFYRYEDFINHGYWKKVEVCCGYVYYDSASNAILIDPSLFKSCCPIDLRSPQSCSTSEGDAAGGSTGGTSDGGSIYGDESLDGDTYFGPSNSSQSDTSLLTQLAAALCT
ncbi:Protein FAM60A [Armadillidium vulgare]|nr:Protein FAM60A [Armadillidium vulgare]